MDTALSNGDFSPGSNGLPRRLAGTQELFQRAMIRLSVPLGSLDYDAALGSRLHGLNPSDADFPAKAAAAAQGALRPLPCITVKNVRVSSQSSPAVTVTCVCGEERKEIEVKL